jgi:DNA-binding FadR family transcriptional regulator
MQPDNDRVERGPKVAELIARRIVRDIAARQLKAGDLLPSEAEMISSYEVGRGSLREALRLLEVNGLIKMKPGRNGGPIVNALDDRYFGRMATLYFQLSGATFDDLLDAAGILEPALVRYIAERHDEHQLKQLRKLIGEIDNVAADDVQRNFLSGSHFHTAIATMTGNPVLALLSAAVREIYRNQFDVEAPWDAMRAEHEEIASAMLEGDAAKAEQLMRAHGDRIAAIIRKLHPALLAQTIDWS